MTRKLKNGFTIAEVLIVLAIVSILTVIALTNTNPREKSIKYILSNTYYSLDKAFYNSYTVDNIDPFASDLGHEEANDEGSLRLCKALTSYINSPDQGKGCSASKLVSIKAETSDFSDDKIQFTSPQGVRFYITKKLGSGDSGFYLIFADINGSAKPNSALYEPADISNNKKRTDPDIFAFAALPIGRVIPIGAPEVELAYMQTRVIYEYMDPNTEETYSRFSNTKVPFYIAKAIAWGYNTNATGAPQGNDSPNSADEPFTWNDYIRSFLSDSVILKNFPSNLTITDKKYQVNEGKPADTNMKCDLADYDTCGVNIDRYLY